MRLIYWMKKPFFLIPLFTAVGVLIGAICVGRLGTYGNVWERQDTIATACQKNPFCGVFLGNSVSMNGVDTKIISEKFASGKDFYNFSSCGQNLLESLAILGHLPQDCGVVALGVIPTAFQAEEDVPQDVWTKY